MSEESLPELLQRFGLSQKEIDTYLALLEHGEAKASVIADEADISKRYVYSVSEDLEKKGFVEVKSHIVPTMIEARAPDEVIDGLRTDVDAIHSGLVELYTEPKPTTEQIEVVKSKITAFKRMRSLIREAESEIAFSIPANYLNNVADELRDAVDRGVLVMLLVTNCEEQLELDGLASVARSWEEVMPTILAIDSERGIFAPAELLLQSDTNRQGIVFAQKQLGPVIVGSFFGNYWPAATEQYVAEPRPLPATYRGFRHASLQAALHQRDGTSVRAEITGRKTSAPDEQVTIAGDVVRVVQGLLKPANNDFPIEHSLVIDTGEEHVTVGGAGAFVEDIEAEEIRLSEAQDR